MKRRIQNIFSCCLCAISIGSCGNNPLREFDRDDPAENAVLHMEKGSFDKAIEVLIDAMGFEAAVAYDLTNTDAISSSFRSLGSASTEKDVWKWISLLSAAVGNKYGIDPLEIALQMAAGDSEESTDGGGSGGETSSGSSSEGGTNNEITALFPILPKADSEHISGLDKAVAILSAIPADHASAADNFKLSMLTTAAFSLRTKTLDADGDGQISTLESVTLPDADAATILAQIDIAQAALSRGNAGGDGESSAKAAERIASFKTKIGQQDGATQEEQFRNFIASD